MISAIAKKRDARSRRAPCGGEHTRASRIFFGAVWLLCRGHIRQTSTKNEQAEQRTLGNGWCRPHPDSNCPI